MAAESTHELRRRILREHRPDLPVAYPQDEMPGTFHLAAVTDAGRVVGIVSFTPEPCPDRPGLDAVRFRGMAVEPGWRGSGVGARLLEEGIDRVAARGAQVVWANGRDPVLGFYRRLGFDTVGESFLDIDIPHTRIVRVLGA